MRNKNHVKSAILKFANTYLKSKNCRAIKTSEVCFLSNSDQSVNLFRHRYSSNYCYYIIPEGCHVTNTRKIVWRQTGSMTVIDVWNESRALQTKLYKKPTTYLASESQEISKMASFATISNYGVSLGNGQWHLMTFVESRCMPMGSVVTFWPNSSIMF